MENHNHANRPPCRETRAYYRSHMRNHFRGHADEQDTERIGRLQERGRMDALWVLSKVRRLSLVGLTNGQ